MARRVQSSGRKTDYIWSSFGDANSDLAIAENSVQIGSTIGLSATSQTLYRTRGLIGVTLDAGGAAEVALVQFAIAVVSDPAAAAGIGSVPTPVTEPGFPFLWRGEAYVTSGAEVAVIPDHLSTTILIDSKAMRKLKDTDSIILVAEVAASVSQSGTIDFSYSINILTGA